MNKTTIFILLMLALSAGFTAYGETTSLPEHNAPQDSTIDVIAWFNKHDSATYWINESSWNINENDTVLTASAAIKVRINVVDSTANGYKMDYTFMEFPTDTLPDSASALERFQNKITAKLGNKIVGTTVHFETDECGRIMKYNNLRQIKKQAKSLFNEAIKDFSTLPEIKVLKEMEFDLKDFAKQVDTDKLVDGYLEELNMLFLHHGKCMKIGEFSEHEDATESSFENSSFTSISADADDGSYQIVCDVVNIVPQSELKAFVGGIVESLNDDDVKNSFNESFDDQVNVDCTYEDFMKMDYLSNGWPYSILRQKSTMISNRGKAKQTVISLDSYSFSN